MSRSYATPSAFKQALEQKLADEAKRLGQPLARVRQMLVFDRFLARVFAVRQRNVIVKGGVVVELRLGRARTTKDIDLWWSGSAAEVLAQLREAALLDLEPITFDVNRDRAHPDLTAAGMKYEGLRFRVQARLAGKPLGDPFGVDVAFSEPVTEPAEEIVGRDLLAFAGVPAARILVYPRSTHLAEKLHALTLPRPKPNSRVKDLPDIALLASAGPLAAATLRDAIERTFAHRATHAIPTTLPAPPSTWAAVYERMARNDDLPWRSFEELDRAARAFIEPVLGPARVARVMSWDPAHWRWRED